tara:strand:+ start:1458 stop:2150 length:693 start_codon:yes stop_codon:yes gene_type:complete
MRIWDINPGYLNDKSLLGEHVELHGLVSILTNNKKGYSNHPETKRWVGYNWAISKRHELLVSEMKIRGFNHQSPIIINSSEKKWPKIYLDTPRYQFEILSEKYNGKKSGRIPLPTSAQQLWSQHKYSIMARDVNIYKKMGREISNIKPNECFEDLSQKLVEIIRVKPTIGGIRNALQHMWGYFKNNDIDNIDIDSLDLVELLATIQKLSYTKKEKYICESTALVELGIWI